VESLGLPRAPADEIIVLPEIPGCGSLVRGRGEKVITCAVDALPGYIHGIRVASRNSRSGHHMSHHRLVSSGTSIAQATINNADRTLWAAGYLTGSRWQEFPSLLCKWRRPRKPSI
jgi:hypothetical protein